MLTIITLLFACSTEPTSAPETTPAPVEKGVQGAQQQVLMQNLPTPTVTTTPPPVVKDQGAFDPLAGKTLSEICLSSGLSLIKWSFADRQSNKNELCCGPDGLPEDDMECMLDWPSSDVPSCSMYDEMRNAIYAHYGRSFKTEKWKKHFAAQDWYTPRPDYSDDWLSPVALANVKLLVEKKANKSGCMD